MISKLFFYLGLFTAAKYLSQLLSFIYLFVRTSSLPRYLHSTSSWALVTGSSDGLGRGFAEELCDQGFNVVLHGRNPAKLERLKADLNRDFPGRSIRIAVADSLQSDRAGAIQAVIDVVQDLNLTVLVNNVGGTLGIVTPTFKMFERQTSREVDDGIQLNLGFATRLTHALLPILQRNQPSLIINISSAAGIMSMPYLVVYSSSKAYNVSFSRHLSAELKVEGKDIEVLGIIVGDTVTPGGRPGTVVSLMTPSPRTMARATLQKVGCGREVVPGYMMHALQIYGVSCLPGWLSASLLAKAMKKFKEDAEAYAKRA
ncbi:MAG: hypothetical protein FRX48_05688 [Lasallia pustulata]|uniref:Short-chain dehydrogenase/reductase SDR n=1 Tax=Lasallia pustulata TaxID=136370 RepID=A0A1W5CX42_9LECA|nr:MAG: hypothetical protein FRX48_05688 [Lasallia pustulata]SLM35443.1 Short-chain dehydrogenase/reductase SDR [Lasallia pustulata]